jgi:ABC-type glutathione transport system ATPase component
LRDLCGITREGVSFLDISYAAEKIGLRTIAVKAKMIVVAHRLSTIRKADQIIVMKSGMIVETGNHESLMKNRKYYYELIQSQYELDTEGKYAEIQEEKRLPKNEPHKSEAFSDSTMGRDAATIHTGRRCTLAIEAFVSQTNIQTVEICIHKLHFRQQNGKKYSVYVWLMIADWINNENKYEARPVFFSNSYLIDFKVEKSHLINIHTLI